MWQSMSNEDIQLHIRLIDPPMKLNLAFSFTFKSSSEGSYLNQNISTLMLFQFPLFTWKQLMYIDRRCSSFSCHLSRKRIPLLPFILDGRRMSFKLVLVNPLCTHRPLRAKNKNGFTVLVACHPFIIHFIINLCLRFFCANSFIIFHYFKKCFKKLRTYVKHFLLIFKQESI